MNIGYNLRDIDDSDMILCTPPETQTLEDTLRIFEQVRREHKQSFETVGDGINRAYSVIIQAVPDQDDIYEVIVKHSLNSTGDYSVVFHDNTSGEIASEIWEFLRNINDYAGPAVTYVPDKVILDGDKITPGEIEFNAQRYRGMSAQAQEAIEKIIPERMRAIHEWLGGDE